MRTAKTYRDFLTCNARRPGNSAETFGSTTPSGGGFASLLLLLSWSQMMVSKEKFSQKILM